MTHVTCDDCDAEWHAEDGPYCPECGGDQRSFDHPAEEAYAHIVDDAFGDHEIDLASFKAGARAMRDEWVEEEGDAQE